MNVASCVMLTSAPKKNEHNAMNKYPRAALLGLMCGNFIPVASLVFWHTFFTDKRSKSLAYLPACMGAAHGVRVNLTLLVRHRTRVWARQELAASV